MIHAWPFAVSPRLVAYGAVVAAFVAMASFAGCEHRAAAGARSERDALASQAVQWRQANGDNVRAIASLRGAVEKWRALAVPARPDLAEAAERYRVELEAARAALIRLSKEADHAKPECLALLAVDFERACPATAASLRSQAAYRPGADRGGARPGGGAAEAGAVARLRAALPISGGRP